MKRILASTLCMAALLCCTLFSSPVVANASQEVVTGSTDNPQNVNLSATSGAPVYAGTDGDDSKYKYNVEIVYGALNVYTYSYGTTWNPATHSYGTGSASAGWDTSQFTENNIGITVINNSNYPIHAQFSYDMIVSGTASAFNNRYYDNGSVVGTFKNNISDFDSDFLNAGRGDSDVNSAMTAEADIDILDCNLYDYQAGSYKTGYVFGTLNTGTNGSRTNQETKYFAFSGKPDAGKNITANTQVGTLHVTITPADSAKVNIHQ